MHTFFFSLLFFFDLFITQPIRTSIVVEEFRILLYRLLWHKDEGDLVPKETNHRRAIFGMLLWATIDEPRSIATEFRVNQNLSRSILLMKPAKVKQWVLFQIGGEVCWNSSNIRDKNCILRNFLFCKHSFSCSADGGILDLQRQILLVLSVLSNFFGCFLIEIAKVSEDKAGNVFRVKGCCWITSFSQIPFDFSFHVVLPLCWPQAG